MKKILVVIIWAAVLSSLVYYLIYHAGELNNIRRVSISDIALISFLFVLNQYFNGMRVGLLLSRTGLALGARECFHLSNITTMANYLPFKSGTIVSAVYFKNRHDISYFKFINISVASLIFQLFTILLVSTFGILLHYKIAGVFFYQLFYVFCLILSGLAVFWIILGLLSGTKVMPAVKSENIRKSVDELHSILTDRALLLKLFMINLAAIAIMSLRFAIAFKMLNYNASFILSFLAGQLKSLAMLINVTPSGLGLAELLAGGMSKLAGGNIAIGVYAASVDRMISIIILIFLSALSFFYLKRRHLFDAGKGQ